jgi:hypothetical protein
MEVFMGITKQIIRGVRNSSRSLEKSSTHNSKRGKKRRENYRRGRRR